MATGPKVQLGGTLIKPTNIDLGNFNMSFTLNGTGAFKLHNLPNNTTFDSILVIGSNGSIEKRSLTNTVENGLHIDPTTKKIRLGSYAGGTGTVVNPLIIPTRLKLKTDTTYFSIENQIDSAFFVDYNGNGAIGYDRTRANNAGLARFNIKSANINRQPNNTYVTSPTNLYYHYPNIQTAIPNFPFGLPNTTKKALDVVNFNAANKSSLFYVRENGQVGINMRDSTGTNLAPSLGATATAAYPPPATVSSTSPHMLDVRGFGSAANWVTTIQLVASADIVFDASLPLNTFYNLESGPVGAKETNGFSFIDPDIYEPNGKVEIKLVVVYDNMTGGSGVADFRLNASCLLNTGVGITSPQYLNMTYLDCGGTGTPPVGTGCPTPTNVGTNKTGNEQMAFITDWRKFDGGTINAWKIQLQCRSPRNIRVRNAYILIRPQQY